MNELYAAPLKRFLAFLIDWYLSSLLGSIPIILLQSICGGDLIILNSLKGLPLPLAWLAGILALACHFLYYCFLPSRSGKYWLSGQTIGMKLMHIRLLTVQKEAVSLMTLSLRHMLFVVLLQSYLTGSGIYLTTLFEMSANFSITPYVQTFSYVVILISLGIYFFSKRKQLLQDLLTKTRMYATEI